MTEREKQQIRIYLRPQAIRMASDLSEILGQNLSETIEACIASAHLPLQANGATENDSKMTTFITPFWHRFFDCFKN